MNSTALVIEKPSNEEESNQFKAFRARVETNLHVPYLPEKVLQYYIQRPDLIPDAISRGFNNMVSDGEFERVRYLLNNFIEKFPTSEDFNKDNTTRTLTRWIFAQSRGLVEEVVLFTPYDPDDRTSFDEEVGRNTCEFINAMCRSNTMSIYYYMKGLGIPLVLSTGLSNGVCNFYLTFKGHNRGKARRLSWAEAVKAIAPPKQVIETTS